jgi:hypothetical protein
MRLGAELGVERIATTPAIVWKSRFARIHG